MQNVYARDVNITGGEVGTFSTMGINRNVYQYGEIASSGAVELNNMYSFKSGFLFEISKPHVEIKLFGGTHITPWLRVPLIFSLSYMYDGLPKYEVHSNTILPYVSYNGKWAGVSIGTSFRFTSFFKERALFEPILSVSVYANFVNNERLRVGLVSSNFNAFSAGNAGSYSLGVNSAVRINEQLSIINEFEIKQSGSIGLSANLYGIAWKGGFQFAW